ncbi:MAG: hypothetical protein K6C05_08555 [Anaerovibrio sp.]|uniref:hypothetical protein n=1 Tax=Anaerovibrio sp. TaxID=1872532 RepID=UPI0025EE3337|nr:hypothetical protein [Anaerovibrio sp.]MCR5176887.1 hypothetical protein [Anaerovibrio sp.]
MKILAIPSFLSNGQNTPFSSVVHRFFLGNHIPQGVCIYVFLMDKVDGRTGQSQKVMQFVTEPKKKDPPSAQAGGAKKDAA